MTLALGFETSSRPASTHLGIRRGSMRHDPPLAFNVLHHDQVVAFDHPGAQGDVISATFVAEGAGVLRLEGVDYIFVRAVGDGLLKQSLNGIAPVHGAVPPHDHCLWGVERRHFVGMTSVEFLYPGGAYLIHRCG